MSGHRHAVRHLRPCLARSVPWRAAPARAFARAAVLWKGPAAERDVTHDYEKRVAQLRAVTGDDVARCYPRLPPAFSSARQPIVQLRAAHGDLEPGHTCEATVTAVGRVKSVRTAGSKLVFLDIDDGSGTIQAVTQLGTLEDPPALEDFKASTRVARRGDWYAVTGRPHRTARGELSVLATRLPRLLSPSLHQIPDTLEDPETRARNRHVDMLVNSPSSIQPLFVRHHVEKHMHAFFDDAGFVKVSTPILTAGAGGAVARPFETVATELEGQTLNLRIAPELWLKRLVVGGMSRVYEVGPAFRNEGVDATHNPEFSICEFYEAFATLEQLMTRTEALLAGLQQYMDGLAEPAAPKHVAGLPRLDISLQGPYKRLEFIPALQEATGHRLPDLTGSNAPQQVLELTRQVIPKGSLPVNPTLPRLLDALAAQFLEPQSQSPTFITNHPACLSPLSKHFICPATGQVVAARAELFIRGREYANMYEEENSPFEQRRKFQEQLEYRGIDGEGDGRADVDESYLEALEWGMPPTGGWGCGMDRLVMLFAGRERMADVLGFGSLRNVVGLSRERPR